MTPQVNQPSRWYYLLSLFVVALGVALFFVITFKGVSGITDKLMQMEAPGVSEMTFNEPGKYTIFYEHQAVLNGKIYNTGGNLSGLWLDVVSRETNIPVAIRQPSYDTSYSVGNRSGVSVLEFNIDRPGVYQVTAVYRDNSDGREIVLAIGHGVDSRIVASVFGALAALFGSLILSLVIVIVTFIKRRRAKKALTWAGYPPYQPSPVR